MYNSTTESVRSYGVPLGVGLGMATLPSKIAAQSLRNLDDAVHPTGPLHALISTIIDQHHAYLKRELPAIEVLLTEAARDDAGKSRTVAPAMLPVFLRFRRELEAHMKREETTLFPLIERMETTVAQDRPAPINSFGPLSNAIAFMKEDHVFGDKLLQMMDEISHGFTSAPDAPVHYLSAMNRLRALSLDMAEHVRKEDEKLFPEAIRCEESGRMND